MMAGLAMTENEPGRNYPSDAHRRQKVKNRAVLAVLVAFVVLVYFVAIVRMGGG